MNPLSPCLRVCRLDLSGLCVACFRTRDEIARWSKITDEDRLEIMAGLDRRRQAITSLSNPAGDLGQSRMAERSAEHCSASPRDFQADHCSASSQGYSSGAMLRAPASRAFGEISEGET